MSQKANILLSGAINGGNSVVESESIQVEGTVKVSVAVPNSAVDQEVDVSPVPRTGIKLLMIKPSAKDDGTRKLVYKIKGNTEVIDSEATAPGVGPYTGTATLPVRPNTVVLKQEKDGGGFLTAKDDGAGNLVGADVSAGTINYSTGAISVTWNSNAANPSDLTLSLEYSLDGTHIFRGPGQASFLPADPASLLVSNSLGSAITLEILLYYDSI